MERVRRNLASTAYGNRRAHILGGGGRTASVPPAKPLTRPRPEPRGKRTRAEPGRVVQVLPHRPKRASAPRARRRVPTAPSGPIPRPAGPEPQPLQFEAGDGQAPGCGTASPPPHGPL